MIKILAQTPKGPLFGFGLSRENITRLAGGEPIHVNLADMGAPNMHVVIIFGETEEAIFREMKAAGLFPPEAEFVPVNPDEKRALRFKVE